MRLVPTRVPASRSHLIRALAPALTLGWSLAVCGSATAAEHEGESGGAQRAIGSAHVGFEAQATNGRWRLVDGDGEVLCALPCSRWVPPRSGWRLELQAEHAQDVRRIPVPDAFAGMEGREVVATIVPQVVEASTTEFNPGVGGSIALTLGGLGLILGGTMAGYLVTSDDSAGFATVAQFLAAVGFATGVPATAVGLVVSLESVDRVNPEHLDIRLAGDPAPIPARAPAESRTTLAPTGVWIGASRSGAGVGVTPFGVFGRF
jgi:hypothetical protein